jgi:hypothetical protein
MQIPTRPLSFGLGEWFDLAVMAFVLGLVLLAIDLAERRTFAQGD